MPKSAARLRSSRRADRRARTGRSRASTGRRGRTARAAGPRSGSTELKACAEAKKRAEQGQGVRGRHGQRRAARDPAVAARPGPLGRRGPCSSAPSTRVTSGGGTKTKRPAGLADAQPAQQRHREQHEGQQHEVPDRPARLARRRSLARLQDPQRVEVAPRCASTPFSSSAFSSAPVFMQQVGIVDAQAALGAQGEGQRDGGQPLAIERVVVMEPAPALAVDTNTRRRTACAGRAARDRRAPTRRGPPRAARGGTARARPRSARRRRGTRRPPPGRRCAPRPACAAGWRRPTR